MSLFASLHFGNIPATAKPFVLLFPLFGAPPFPKSSSYSILSRPRNVSSRYFLAVSKCRVNTLLTTHNAPGKIPHVRERCPERTRQVIYYVNSNYIETRWTFEKTLKYLMSATTVALTGKLFNIHFFCPPNYPAI